MCVLQQTGGQLANLVSVALGEMFEVPAARSDPSVAFNRCVCASNVQASIHGNCHLKLMPSSLAKLLLNSSDYFATYLLDRNPHEP